MCISQPSLKNKTLYKGNGDYHRKSQPDTIQEERGHGKNAQTLINIYPFCQVSEITMEEEAERV